MNKLLIYIRTFYKLGLLNVISVFSYRVLTYSFFGIIFFPKKLYKQLGPVFLPATTIKKVSHKHNTKIIEIADSILKGNVFYYSYHQKNVGQTPNWFLNPFNSKTFVCQKEYWTKLNDFDSNVGDIKNIWEISRFNWLGTLAQVYSITHDDKYLELMNHWVKDWCDKNPVNMGPNWKCGQETSIRAINILLAYEIIGFDKISPSLVELLKIHIDRVWPTTFYAKAQDNNHGISEGVALYLLGFFLWKETKRKKYFSLSLKGLKLIENRVQKLIMDDGSFSQYSVVYHRMILDLLSVLELTRQRWGLDSFSREFYNKVKLSVQWYSDIIDPISGNAPNMGGNDGTYLFNYDQKEYRDFRPTLSLASSIFKMPINRDLNVGHILLEIFNISPSILKEERSISKAYIQGGYIKLVRKNGMAFLRVPKYKFKPSHADALHLDIWQDGINWIRDAGSFSYALNIDEQEQYSGTQGHSTIQFDNRNQMPRLSRFLFGDWLSSDQINFNESNNSVCASYTDGKNVKHTRIVNSVINGWQIQDDISGNFKKGVMRWILKPGDWEIEKHSIRNGNISLEIISDHISSFQVIQGFESLFYMEKTQVPILTIEFFDECSINTQVLFTA